MYHVTYCTFVHCSFLWIFLCTFDFIDQLALGGNDVLNTKQKGYNGQNVTWYLSSQMGRYIIRNTFSTEYDHHLYPTW